MRTPAPPQLTLLILLACGSIVAQAPNPAPPDEPGNIFAAWITKAGLINKVEGDVTCSCVLKAGESSHPKRELTRGDIVRVGTNSRAEILLTPGYYLRLAGNTTVEFLDLTPSNLKVKLMTGSAILEVVTKDSASNLIDGLKIMRYEMITLIAPNAEYAVYKAGIYRMDIRGPQWSEMRVLKGQAVTSGITIDEREIGSVQNGQTQLTKSATRTEDPFDNWSRNRAQLLVKANKSLKQTEMYRLLKARGFRYFNMIGPDEEGVAPEDFFIVSAATGLVNFVERGVSYRRDKGAWQKLERGVRLQTGDEIRTGKHSRAEVLLYPGCHLYLAGDTEINYAEAADAPVIGLTRGQAVIVAKLRDDQKNMVRISVRGLEYAVSKGGRYRLNVTTDSGSELLVYDGKARVGNAEISEGKKVVQQGARVDVLSFPTDSQDSFDVWSRKKAVALGLRYDWEHRYLRLLTGNWVLYSGMWFFSPPLQTFTFVPFPGGCHSPYGGDYSVAIENVHLRRPRGIRLGW